MRHVLLLDLRDDPETIAQYEAHHAPGAVPDEIVASIRSAGITEMEIYRTGNRLVLVMETDESFDPARKAAADRANAAVCAWEALMSRYQQPLPWAGEGEKWLTANRIFTLPAADSETPPSQ